MYNLDIDELINTIQEKRKGLAYTIWRVASFTRNPFVKDFPETPEKAMPELFPKRKGIKMQEWMINKYIKKERR